MSVHTTVHANAMSTHSYPWTRARRSYAPPLSLTAGLAITMSTRGTTDNPTPSVDRNFRLFSAPCSSVHLFHSYNTRKERTEKGERYKGYTRAKTVDVDNAHV